MYLALTVWWGGAFLLSLAGGLFGVFLFDAPGSENNVMLVRTYNVLVALPVSLGLGTLLGGGATFKDNRRLALASLLLPLPHLLLFAWLCSRSLH
jgi:hypothetical protein